MADAVPATQNAASSTLQSSQGQLVQIIGKLVGNTGSQNDDLVTALTNVLNAITAKPSA